LLNIWRERERERTNYATKSRKEVKAVRTIRYRKKNKTSKIYHLKRIVEREKDTEEKKRA